MGEWRGNRRSRLARVALGSTVTLVMGLAAVSCGDDDTASLDSTPASTSSTTTGTLVVDDTTSTTTSPSTTTAAPSSTTTAAEWPGATFSPSPLPDVLIAHDDVMVENNDHVILFVVDKRRIAEVEQLFQVGLTFF